MLASKHHWRGANLPSVKLWLGASLGPGPCSWTRSAGSLSPIHRGKFKSQQAEKQLGASENDKIGGRNLLFRRGETRQEREDLTRRAMLGISSSRGRRRLLKKVEEMEEEDKVQPKSRRKRWHDPEEKYGKRSLVYNLKHGKLRDLVDELEVSGGQRTGTQAESRLEPEQPKSEAPLILPHSLQSSPSATPPDPEKRPVYVPIDGPPQWDLKENYKVEEEDEEPDSDDESEEEAWRRERYKGVPPANSSMMEERFEVAEKRRQQAIDTAVGNDMRLLQHPTGFRGKGQEKRLASLLKSASPVTFVGRNPLASAASQFLYGRTVVQAALESQRRKLYRLYVYGGPNRKASRAQCAVMEMARVRGIPTNMVVEESTAVLDKMSEGRPHNGLVLEASPLPMPPVAYLRKLQDAATVPGFEVQLNWQSIEDEEINGKETLYFQSNPYGRRPLILLLIGIMDPGNLGAVLRTAGFLGVDGVGIARDKSAGLTPVVLKAAAGATENLNIFDVDDPYLFVGHSQQQGWQCFAAVAPPDEKLRRLHPERFVSQRQLENDDPLSREPCLLIFGNEGFGISKTLRVLSDYELSVPRFSYNCSVDSLNVSVAAALLCQSFLRKGQPEAFSLDTAVPDDEGPKSKSMTAAPPIGEMIF